jgi:hypothetical protein
MGTKCLLLYRAPQGGAPGAADAERLVAALHRVCGVHQGRSAERQLEARCNQLRQLPVRGWWAGGGRARPGPARLAGAAARRRSSSPPAPPLWLHTHAPNPPHQARDLTIVKQPRQLADLWLLQLPQEAPDRVFLVNP